MKPKLLSFTYLTNVFRDLSSLIRLNIMVFVCSFSISECSYGVESPVHVVNNLPTLIKILKSN